MHRSILFVATLLILSACGDDDPTVVPPPAPVVTTGGAVSVGSETATVNGTVDTLGEEGVFWFEFGTDVSYGSSSDETAIPTGPSGPRTVEDTLTALPPNSTVHFRLVARTPGGVGEGEDVLFVTPRANRPPDTQVVAAGSDTTAAEVSAAVYWFGMDADGTISRYEWRLADHGADGALDVADSLAVPWATTVVTDTTFTWPDGLGSRTFFVRAIDDREARDPSPASWTFEASEQAR